MHWWGCDTILIAILLLLISLLLLAESVPPSPAGRPDDWENVVAEQNRLFRFTFFADDGSGWPGWLAVLAVKITSSKSRQLEIRPAHCAPIGGENCARPIGGQWGPHHLGKCRKCWLWVKQSMKKELFGSWLQVQSELEEGRGAWLSLSWPDCWSQK